MIFFFTKNPNLLKIFFFFGGGGGGVLGGMARVSDFLSSPLAGKRDIVVTILVWCMCMPPCISPNLSGLIRLDSLKNITYSRFGFIEKKIHLLQPPSPPPPPAPPPPPNPKKFIFYFRFGFLVKKN